MSTITDWPIALEGVWRYAGSVPVKVRILQSPSTWGTGDGEDSEHAAKDLPIPCFFLAYEAAGSPGDFCNLIPNLATLEEALAHAAEKFPNIEWHR